MHHTLARRHVLRAPVLLNVLALTLVGACGGRTRLLVDGFESDSNGGGGSNPDSPPGDASDSPKPPPIEDLGDPGWHESTTPWVGEDHDIQSVFAVWSRPEAVYVIHGGFPASGHVGSPPYPHQLRISSNDGSGWKTQLAWGVPGIGGAGMSYTLFTGFPDGRLLVGGDFTASAGLVSLIDGQQSTDLAFSSHSAFVVDNELAYAASDHEKKIMRYDADHWEPLPVDSPYEISRLWADQTSLFGVGPHGTVVSLEADGWHVHDIGSVDSLSQVWGFGPDDVWVAGASADHNLSHWNGQTWSPVDWPLHNPTDPSGWTTVEGMWGADGVLFFHTRWEIVRCTSSPLQCEQIAYWPCTAFTEGEIQDCKGSVVIQSMWGNSPQELFFAVSATPESAGHPEDAYLLWYDGVAFHWF